MRYLPRVSNVKKARTTMTLIPLLLFGCLVQDSKAIYRDTKLGLQFEYPKVWKLRKDKFATVLEFNTEKGTPVQVQLFSARFKDSADTWQLIQVEINKGMKRTVDRQYQEEFLGVPMLMTRISYTDANRAMFGLTGLLYTSFEEKLNFRVSGPIEGADDGIAAWHEVLLTLRTTTGDLPTAEDPNKPSVKPEEPKPTKIWKQDQSSRKPIRGAQIQNFKVGGQEFVLNLPKDWKFESGQLSHPSIKGSINLDLGIAILEEAASKLNEVSGAALTQFEKVRLRVDSKPFVAESGAIVGQIFRYGETKGQTLSVGHILGSCQAVYWLVTYKGKDEASTKSDLKVLNDLIEHFYVEKA